mmetsp:Transcript_29447/g.90271  ORF Transcript_29447/g.90271 Transcript_29447/m.90271 type:complete len:128 (-) Transcript_29447:857-1240(-)
MPQLDLCGAGMVPPSWQAHKTRLYSHVVVLTAKLVRKQRPLSADDALLQLLLVHVRMHCMAVAVGNLAHLSDTELSPQQQLLPVDERVRPGLSTRRYPRVAPTLTAWLRQRLRFVSAAWSVQCQQET